MKLIFPVVLVFGAVACEPLPVYPPNGGPRPYPPQRRGYENQQPQAPDQYGNSDYREERPGYESEPQAPTRDSYPVAEKTDNPDRVISPFSPYNVIDVEGFRSGQLAKDPSNGKIFRIP